MLVVLASCSAEKPAFHPSAWKADHAMRCSRYGKRRFCDGPLRVPEPHGEAAALAVELGLGRRSTASYLYTKPPKRKWVRAVKADPEDNLLWPVPEGHFVRGFGRTRKHLSSIPHEAVDIAAPEGTHMVAVNDGLVAYSGNEIRGYGNVLMIIHADQSVSMYAHCRKIYVFAGQRVKRGQIVAELGNTGITRGPHLHFEWRRYGKRRNPMPYFTGRPDRRSKPKKKLARTR